jgi:hypothetical protein
MCVDEQIENNNGSSNSQGNCQDTGLRIDFVDNWHKQWPAVLKAIESTGQREALLVDQDGWLSARQCLLVAFDQEQIVGHLFFSIQPSGVSSGVPASAEMRSLGSRPRVDAHLDAMDVKPGLCGATVRSLLMDAATRRAQSLRCRSLIGFEVAN